MVKYIRQHAENRSTSRITVIPVIAKNKPGSLLLQLHLEGKGALILRRDWPMKNVDGSE